MYDAQEKAIRDRQWEMNAARREGEIKGEIKGKIEGKIEGEIKSIRMLQGLLCVPVSPDEEFHGMNLEQLEAVTSDLQEKLRNREPS